jgi:hypothetical protein
VVSCQVDVWLLASSCWQGFFIMLSFDHSDATGHAYDSRSASQAHGKNLSFYWLDIILGVIMTCL